MSETLVDKFRDMNIRLKSGLLGKCKEIEAKKAGKEFKRDKQDIWKHEPVSPEEFIKGAKFLNENTGRIWQCVIDDMKTIFCGPDKFGRPSFFPACQVFLDNEGIGCLDGETEIYTSSGRKQIKDLVGESGSKVPALSGNLKLVRSSISDGIDNGRRKCLKVKFRSGKEIVATGNHPFFGKRGWQRLDEIDAGDLVATPRVLELEERNDISPEEMSLLAYMIGDGACTGGTPTFTTALEAVKSDFTRCAESIGCDVVLKANRGRAKTWSVIRRKGQGKKDSNALTRLLRKHGVWNKKSLHKRVPESVVYSSRLMIARFVGCLLSTDGSVEKSSINYYTSSRQLADDIVTLYLRLGIHASIRSKRTSCNGKWFDSFVVSTTGAEAVRMVSILNMAGGVPGKQSKLDHFYREHAKKKRNTNVDVTPFGNKELSSFIRGSGRYRKLWQKYKNAGSSRLSREKLARLATDIGDEQLQQFAESDIYWDKVVQIEPCGVRHVYDLTVPGPSNFVANNIIVHNSGKSTKIAVMNAYLIYLLLCLRDPLEYFELFDSSLLLMNVAPTEAKAKEIVFIKTQNIINRCKWFEETNNKPEARLKSKMKFYQHFNTEGMTEAELRQLDLLEEKGKAEVMPVLVVSPGNSAISAPTGADLYFGVMDEACSDEGFETATVDRAEAIFENMNERRQSRFMEGGIICCISSAGSEDRWMEKKITEIEAYRVREKIPPEQKIIEYQGLKWYVIRRPSYEANPKYERYFKTGDVFTYNNVRVADDGTQLEDKLVIPNLYKAKFENDPHTSLKNICSLPTSSVYRYITNWNGILKRINMDREDPCPDPGDDMPLTVEDVKEQLAANPDFIGEEGKWYYVHVDLATGGTSSSGKDGAGLCIGHRGDNIVRGEGTAKPVQAPTVVIDLSVRLKTHGKTVKTGESEMKASEMEIQLSDVRDFLIWLNKEKGFRFSKITFDGWQSKDSIQILTEMGYLCEKDSVTNDSFDTMRELWYDDRLDTFYDKHMLWELRKLERKANGKIEKSVGASDDEIECVAKVCEHCVEGELPEIRKPRARGRVASGVGGNPSLPNMGGVRHSGDPRQTYLRPAHVPKQPGLPRPPHRRRK